MQFCSLNKGYLVVALIVMSACSNAKFSYDEFEAPDSLEIIMPEEYLQVTNWSTYNDKGETVLVEYGINGKSDLVIHQVDFIDMEYRSPIIIEQDGPNGFNSSEASVYFKSRDSIYVFPAAREYFYLYGSDGVRIDRYDYNSENYTRYYRAGYYSNAIADDDQLIIPVVSDVRYDDPEYFSKTVPIKCYDFQTFSFTKHLDYPSHVYGKAVPSSFTGPTIFRFDSASILINYKFSDSLYIWNSSTNEMKSLYCGSDYFGKPKLLDNVPDRVEDLIYKVEEVEYEETFRRGQKLYRIVSHISDKKYRGLPVAEIIEKGYRVVSLVELNLETQELSFYKLPIAKYFVFDDRYLYAGGVSIREEGSLTFREFYRYTLN